MTTPAAPAIVIPSDAPPPVAGGKSGEGYDRCPTDGCREVDSFFRSYGKDTHGQEHADFFLYNADRRDGGCGTTWSRTTTTEAAQSEAKKYKPKWLTQDAARGRVYITSPNSDEYRDNYARIFGHD